MADETESRMNLDLWDALPSHINLSADLCFSTVSEDGFLLNARSLADATTAHLFGARGTSTMMAPSKIYQLWSQNLRAGR